jgi:hypothetical protein
VVICHPWPAGACSWHIRIYLPSMARAYIPPELHACLSIMGYYCVAESTRITIYMHLNHDPPRCLNFFSCYAYEVSGDSPMYMIDS